MYLYKTGGKKIISTINIIRINEKQYIYLETIAKNIKTCYHIQKYKLSRRSLLQQCKKLHAWIMIEHNLLI